MPISRELGVIIMMNNYFHDVATALCIATAFALYTIYTVQKSIDTPAAALFFLKTYKRMARLFRFAFWWIIIGGVPRTVFYTRFEWANAAEKLQIPALMVKHILMAALVCLGIAGWRRLKAEAARLRSGLPEEEIRKL